MEIALAVVGVVLVAFLLAALVTAKGDKALEEIGDVKAA
jgi:hypothetical protein